MPVDARRLIRKMRGGSQAHLIEASDGNYYVVKFLNNPQHRRILVNEWIGTAFLSYLGVSTPEAAIVRVSDDFLRENPEAYFQLGSSRQEIEPGWHFGSRFPGDPARNTIYDFLPDTLLDKVENLSDFLGSLAFDKWVGNADSRQAVFFRARLKNYLPDSGLHPLKIGFVAHMVDHGFIFEGPHWRFTDTPLQGLYFRRMVYDRVAGFDDLQPWLDRIVHFPEEIVDQTVKQIPPAWLDGDEGALEAVLDRLMVRRSQVPRLIEASLESRPSPFPKWSSR